MTGVLTDPAYTVTDGQLSWEQVVRDATLHDPAAGGWQVTAVSVPATVSTQPDGRVVVQVFDGRPGDGLKVAGPRDEEALI